MEPSWKLDIYKDWNEIDDPSFQEQWQRWYDAAPEANVFSQPLLVKTWTDCYRAFQNVQPLYCVARTGDTTFFLPLVVWQRNWKNAFLTLVVPAGYSDYDYHDPLVAGTCTTSLMNSFWTLIVQQVLAGHNCDTYDQIDLNGIRFFGLQPCWEQEESCPFIDMGRYADFQDYFERLGKNLRKDIRRKKRLLDACGSLEFHVYGRQELDRAMRVFPQFLEAHTRRWPNAFKAPGFHEAMLRNGLPSGLVHFSEMRIDGAPVSWEIGFRERSKAYSYMPAYQEDYADHSPGKVHLALLVEECFQRGIRVFDFMRGAEEYKESWTDSTIHVHRYRKIADSLSSRMKIVVHQAFNSVKTLIGASPVCFVAAGLLKKLDLLLRTLFIYNAESAEFFMDVAGCAFLG
ncbi:MAG: GNAT family N-acetyltransferase [Chlorobiaceae bacterium]|nr:GNAT family N-acetyltransferase [Chlorobiaceae bacterium]